jgi:hypothetical protein
MTHPNSDDLRRTAEV